MLKGWGVRPIGNGAGKPFYRDVRAAGETTHTPTTLEWLRPAFVGISGSTKFKFLPSAIQGSGDLEAGLAYTCALGQQMPYGVGTQGNSNIWGYASTVPTAPTKPMGYPFFLLGSIMRFATTGSLAEKGQPIQQSVPYRSAYRFSAAGSGAPFLAGIADTGATTACVGACFRRATNAGGAGLVWDVAMDVWIATGEDFALHHFVACPLLTTTTY